MPTYPPHPPPAASGASTGGAPGFAEFEAHAAQGNLVPLFRRVMMDQLSPIQAYRCLVDEDDKESPSFLFESVTGGTQSGRYSFVGARPVVEVLAKGTHVAVLDHTRGTREEMECKDPLHVPEAMSAGWRPVKADGIPEVFTGGWVGFTGYDTVRYVYDTKIPFSAAPPDTAGFLDMHLCLYKDVVVFDQATKLVYAVSWVNTEEHATLEGAYADGRARLDALLGRLTSVPPPLKSGVVEVDTAKRSEWSATAESNMGKGAFLDAVGRTKEYIQSGDVFQLVLSHRFERRTFADPFEVYRALRVVNPSPYMVYMQARGAIMVASSPEILCRVDKHRVVTNRPLAGTRRRGRDEAEDRALREELLADEKERCEHIMLVDLGRNDVGRVADMGTVEVEKLMEVENYSHVMHISSTVTGTLREELTSWDALRSALPAGTISGAPKVRALQIIDELEVSKRGPYGGGIGHVSFTGELDMCLALRTMIVPSESGDGLYRYGEPGEWGETRKEWRFFIQAGAGIVADSSPEAEHEETVNKAAALARAIDLAEEAFVARE